MHVDYAFAYVCLLMYLYACALSVHCGLCARESYLLNIKYSYRFGDGGLGKKTKQIRGGIKKLKLILTIHCSLWQCTQTHVHACVHTFRKL